MKEIFRYLFICAIFFYSNVKAQDSTQRNNPDKSYFEAGLSYLSNNVYLGRHDSLRIPYLTSSITYYNKSGFYAGSSLSYLNSERISRIDRIELNTGYILTLQKFSGEVFIEKDFYNSQSKNVKSETKGSLNGTLSYDLGFIKPVLQGGILINKRDDYYAAPGLEYSIFLDDDNFEMTPSFLINASTQNYYSSYYSQRKYAAKKKNQTDPGTITKAYLPSSSKFKIMDYEFSLPLDYSLGKFIFDVTPTFADPVNPNVVAVTVTPPSGISVTKTRTEKLKSTFFWSAGITYSFK
jgi:hypothetical protein